MDGFAYQHSPKIDDLKSTYPTESASPRLKSTCSICNHSSGYQYDNQKYSVRQFISHCLESVGTQTRIC